MGVCSGSGDGDSVMAVEGDNRAASVVDGKTWVPVLLDVESLVSTSIFWFDFIEVELVFWFCHTMYGAS